MTKVKIYRTVISFCCFYLFFSIGLADMTSIDKSLQAKTANGNHKQAVPLLDWIIHGMSTPSGFADLTVHAMSKLSGTPERSLMLCASVFAGR
jgi:hypothetical protein